MKKNMYYQTLYRRRNVIMEALLNFFLGLSSYPRMLLEIPIRRNFGERYFSFMGVIVLAILLAIVPIFLVVPMSYRYGGSNTGVFFSKFLTWYLYLIVFVYSANQRHGEIKHLPSVFDFARFSLSTGLIDVRFLNFEFQGKRLSVRTIETVLEPGLFFFIGLVLWFLGQPIGFVLFASSIFYSLSYVAAYYQGDHFIMDKIDEQICNEELVKSFVEDTDPSDTRGFNFYGRKPADPEARRRVADLFTEEEETVVAL